MIMRERVCLLALGMGCERQGKGIIIMTMGVGDGVWRERGTEIIPHHMA